MKYKTIGLVGRFKPLYNGAYAMLEAVCKNAEQVLIGIGSANKYNLRNPFRPEESAEMIERALSDFKNFKIFYIPDFAHIPEYADGKKWKSFVEKRFGELDYFVTSNGYVEELLKDRYRIVHPWDLVEPENQVKMRATEVRLEMARGGNWKELVPEKVAEYLEKEGLVERFRKEFGLKTLATLAGIEIEEETSVEEKAHTLECEGAS